MATPSLSLVESLIGAIPVEVGAALVARVGERATITAKSGSIEVGSVALTVEAMDDLIGHVLPPDQLESLQENGTVHFEFTPTVIGGEFAVLAASTPGDRWLEIRRRSTKVAAPAAAVTEALRAAVAAQPPAQSPAPTPAPTPAPAPSVADDADVAQLLSRFQTPEAAAPSPIAFEPPPSPEPVAIEIPPPAVAVAPAVNPDFDLSAMVPPPEPPPAPIADAGANDDLTIPSNLDFAAAKSDFDLDGLTLPDALPEGPTLEAFDHEVTSREPEDSDHIQTRRETSGMSKSSFSTSTGRSPLRSRSVVLLSVVLGIVALSAAGWYAAQRYFTTPTVAVAPPPAPRKPAPPKPVAQKPSATASSANAANSPGSAPATAARPSPEPASKPATTPAVAKANTQTPTPKPVPAPTAVKASAPAAVPAPTTSHDGYAVQVAAVRERDEADRIVARLVNQGYAGYLIRGQGSAAAYYRVRVAARDRQAAEEVASRLERAEGVKPWIVKETP
jgi:cell division septation protein DedD